eukprot:GHRR01028532.1.p1 GENE.GHRR01028532.1~~GHRR01028532.1.p1  ORF type:complete len:158 (+),score=49.61 GHRR01028532.1:1321-1794(+)
MPAPTAAATIAGGLKAERKTSPAVTPLQPPRTPALPPASPWLQRMPHPSTIKPRIQHVAMLDLPVKTTKGVTIADVAKRLVSTGFYKGQQNWQQSLGSICVLTTSASRSNAAGVVPVVIRRPAYMQHCNCTKLLTPTGSTSVHVRPELVHLEAQHRW